jgi:formylglycine-generating enzyme required for sulfatase activity
MKKFNDINKIWHASLLILLVLVAVISCEDKPLDNPYDEDADYEKFKVADFLIEDSSVALNALSWTLEYQQPDSFLLERKEDTAVWKEHSYIRGDALSFTDSAVIPDLRYGYRLSTIYDKNIVPSDDVWTENLFIDPSDFDVEEISDKSYRLTWTDNSIGEEGFVVLRKVSDDLEWDTLGFTAPNVTSFIDTNVFSSPSKEYFNYRVEAYYQGYFTYSKTETVLAKMDSPSNISFESIALDIVKITWQDNSDGEDGFVVRRSIDGNAFEELARVSDSQLIDSTFTPNSHIKYHIYPYVESTGFGYASATYDAALPKPYNIIINNPSLGTAEMSWQFDETGYDGFKILRENDEFEFEEIGYTEAKHFTDTDLPFNRSVGYRVVAILQGYESDHVQESIYSEFTSPDYLHINATSASTLNLSWDDDYVGEEGFKLDMKIDNGSWQDEYMVLSENTTSHTLTGLDLTDHSYSFRIYAYLDDYETNSIYNWINIYTETVNVTGGTFNMGCNTGGASCNSDELPVHQVTLSSFDIGKYEVTNQQFASYLNNVDCSSNGFLDGDKLINIQSSNCNIEHNGTEFLPVESYEDHPVIYTTWEGANGYAEWAGGRLPTEAEWEYAARGGANSNGFDYSGSSFLNDVGWWEGNASDTYPVGEKEPNELGIYDMSGNAYEWVNDWYDNNYYENSPDDNPTGPYTWSLKVLRGGDVSYSEEYCTVYKRYPSFTDFQGFYGFRVAKD